jgi:hypothetical protein
MLYSRVFVPRLSRYLLDKLLKISYVVSEEIERRFKRSANLELAREFISGAFV